MNTLLQEALSVKVPLRFSADGKFRILMVSDIHGGRGYDADRTIRALDALIDRYTPGLVLLGGDICGPGKIHIETAEELRELLDGLSAPMEKRGIPWAHVYGNHDDNFGLSNAAQQPIYESYPHCVSKAGPDELSGVGNYALPIWDSDGERILFAVYGMDSHHSIYDNRADFGFPENTPFYHPIPGCGSEDGVHFDQLMWYYTTSIALENHCGAKIPAMFYFHIPLPEHALAAQLRDKANFDGTQLEQVACSVVNPGVFAACLQRGDVKAIFCGHDHRNDFCATYGGIRLGYDGFLSYHACHKDLIRGGRIIDLDAATLPELSTYMVRVHDVLGDSGNSPQ